jgi:hypothetical protein
MQTVNCQLPTAISGSNPAIIQSEQSKKDAAVPAATANKNCTPAGSSGNNHNRAA